MILQKRVSDLKDQLTRVEAAISLLEEVLKDNRENRYITRYGCGDSQDAADQTLREVGTISQVTLAAR